MQQSSRCTKITAKDIHSINLLLWWHQTTASNNGQSRVKHYVVEIQDSEMLIISIVNIKLIKA